jgi:hypothetical protein
VTPTEHECPTGEHAVVAVITTHSDLIARAIEKLEALRDTAAPGEWHAWRMFVPLEGPRFGVQAELEQSWGYEIETVATSERAENAELIATLHRTIEPQLAVLRTQVGVVQVDGFALAIARAVLGVTA